MACVCAAECTAYLAVHSYRWEASGDNLGYGKRFGPSTVKFQATSVKGKILNVISHSTAADALAPVNQNRKCYSAILSVAYRNKEEMK